MGAVTVTMTVTRVLPSAEAEAVDERDVDLLLRGKTAMSVMGHEVEVTTAGAGASVVVVVVGH
ncbi:hypothetical protein Tdes44962_MAKER08524 [Teratosphaeria destructans]|uniref:Uncharacterized protein n=1 Tax=Teratosphaeria destructans TaxID=418781 RepID=A0A9W7SW84_9PEZI|nr:hypothetical protein Tdes44962_MAKER08524 [Teratosphaeria destructans]